TGRIVSTKLVLLLPPSASTTLTSIVALPERLAAGTMFTVRLLSPPPNEMLGVRDGLEDNALKVSPAAAVSKSPMVRLMLVGVSSLIVIRFVTMEMEGT